MEIKFNSFWDGGPTLYWGLYCSFFFDLRLYIHFLFEKTKYTHKRFLRSWKKVCVCTHVIAHRCENFNGLSDMYRVKALIFCAYKLIFRFSRYRTYSASKCPSIGFTVLWDILHNRKYAHSSANAIYFPAIHCFTKESRKSDNNFTLFTILALQSRKSAIFNP